MGNVKKGYELGQHHYEGDPERAEGKTLPSHHLWAIFPGAVATAEGQSLKKYFKAREKMVNMKKLRLRL
jgi:hypothetical protein